MDVRQNKHGSAHKQLHSQQCHRTPPNVENAGEKHKISINFFLRIMLIMAHMRSMTIEVHGFNREY